MKFSDRRSSGEKVIQSENATPLCRHKSC